MSLDPNKTYLQWNGTTFPNSSDAQFKTPAGSSIDWGDGVVETFDTASTTVNTHTYTDGKTEHTIAISGLTSIGDYAFYNCTGLKSVTIPNSVTSIGDYAFEYCSGLTSITIPDSVTSIGISAFNDTAYYNNASNWQDGVLYIGKHFIKAKSTLSGDYVIKNGTLTIAGYAFENCIRLTSVTIPNSVTSIGYEAFYNCNGLKQLILFPSTPPTLGTSAILTTISNIYVQQSSKSAYQAATNWTTFASKIVSDNLYLSFARFNQKNKEYINTAIVNAITKSLNTAV